MEKGSILFLRGSVVLIGIGTLAFMLLEPRLEGRNVNATLFQVYFNDLFLAYAYTASISFFVGLYQTFKLLGYIGQNKAFTQNSVRAVRTIKYCAMITIGFIAPAVAYLFIVRPGDDIAGGVFMGILITFASLVIAATADVFERILKSAMERE